MKHRLTNMLNSSNLHVKLYIPVATSGGNSATVTSICADTVGSSVDVSNQSPSSRDYSKPSSYASSFRPVRRIVNWPPKSADPVATKSWQNALLLHSMHSVLLIFHSSLDCYHFLLCLLPLCLSVHRHDYCCYSCLSLPVRGHRLFLDCTFDDCRVYPLAI